MGKGYRELGFCESIRLAFKGHLEKKKKGGGGRITRVFVPFWNLEGGRFMIFFEDGSVPAHEQVKEGAKGPSRGTLVA